MLVVGTTRNSEGQVELARLSINRRCYRVRRPARWSVSGRVERIRARVPHQRGKCAEERMSRDARYMAPNRYVRYTAHHVTERQPVNSAMRVRNARELGALVRHERRRRGMTQREVAVAAGVDRSWVARLEAGSENPTLTNLLAVVAALRLEVFIADTELEAQVASDATECKVGKPRKPTLDDVLARLEHKSKPVAKQ